MTTLTVTEKSYNSVRFELDGMKIHLLREDFKSHLARKPRIYLSGSAIDPEWEHPPYSLKGEDAANDAAWRKYNREEVRLQKALAERGLAALKQTEGFRLFGSGELRFSRKAGCSCGCSPGMLLDGRPYGNAPLFEYDTRIGDIFISADR